MKNLNKVTTVIGWQITRNIAMRIMTIDQSAFIRDLIIKEGLEECNVNVIPIKTCSTIEMLDLNDYDKTNLYKYQCLIGKLMYLLCETKPNIAFVVSQLSRHNADL